MNSKKKFRQNADPRRWTIWHQDRPGIWIAIALVVALGVTILFLRPQPFWLP